MQRLPSREDLIRQVPTGGICAELGVQRGYFSALIHYINRPRELVAIDAWRHQPGPYDADRANETDEAQDELYRFVSDCFAVYPNVRVLRSLTHDAVSMFADAYFDLIYVDACHLLDAVRQDLVDWYPKLKPGGLFAGHDYHDVDHPAIQVRQAVDEFCNRECLVLDFITTEHCGSWGLWKP